MVIYARQRCQRKKIARENNTRLWFVIVGLEVYHQAENRAGGTPETQKDFLETLASDFPDRAQERQKRKAPVANEFALGYTYQDVLDTDHEGKEGMANWEGLEKAKRNRSSCTPLHISPFGTFSFLCSPHKASIYSACPAGYLGCHTVGLG